MKTLGLDIGERRIGVARAGDLGVAVPLLVVSSADPAEAVEELKRLVDKEAPGVVVYGMPLNHKGEQAEQAARVMAMVDRLSAALPGVRFEPVDESFSTRSAADALRAMKVVKPRDRKKVIDKVAAAVILQRYLDYGRNECAKS